MRSVKRVDSGRALPEKKVGGQFDTVKNDVWFWMKLAGGLFIVLLVLVIVLDSDGVTGKSALSGDSVTVKETGSVPSGSSRLIQQVDSSFVEDKQRVVASAVEYVQLIDGLITETGDLGLDEDVKQLQNVKNEFLAYQEKVNSVEDSFALSAVAHTFAETSFPELSNRVGRVQAKIELPKKFTEFFLALDALKQSPDVKWEESQLETLYQPVKQQYESLQQMSPKEKVVTGSVQIAELVTTHKEKLRMLLKPAEAFRLPAESPLGRAQMAGMETLIDTIKPTPKPKVAIQKQPGVKRSLVIIVDGWLEKEGEFIEQLKDVDGVKMQEVHPLAVKVSSDVYNIFKEMSYNNLHWQFEFCDVGSTTFKKPVSVGALFEAAVALCDVQGKVNGQSPDFSQYDSVIVYPGLNDGHGGFATVTTVKILAEDFTFCGVSLAGDNAFKGKRSMYALGGFNKNFITHELGHCLGLPHADAYECGNDAYGVNCVLKTPDEETGLKVYGDLYDLMGNTQPYNSIFGDAAVFPHFNCVYKSSKELGWATAVQVGPGKQGISALELPLGGIPRCLVLPVDSSFMIAGAPCDKLYLEYRTPRRDLFTNDLYGGLALHCANSLLQPYSPPVSLTVQSELLDCTPNYLQREPDMIDGLLLSPQQVCHTDLGYDIVFNPLNAQFGEVTIEAICLDKDTDGFQDPDNPQGCKLTTPPDCDDVNPSLNPDTKWYEDSDNDGFGDSSVSVASCEQPVGYVRIVPGRKEEDCDDGDNQVFPGAKEVCGDGVDQDCSGKDLGCTCKDLDGDGFEDPNNPVGCEVSRSLGDCDDTDKGVHPDDPLNPFDGLDGCDNKDDNCDGVVDGFAGGVMYEVCPRCVDSDKGLDPLVAGFTTTTTGVSGLGLRGPFISTSYDDCSSQSDQFIDERYCNQRYSFDNSFATGNNYKEIDCKAQFPQGGRCWDGLKNDEVARCCPDPDGPGPMTGGPC